MASAPTVANQEMTVSLPAEIVRQLDEMAELEQRTPGEVIAAAVSFYVDGERRWRAAQSVIAGHARASGLRTEDDIEELLDSLPDAEPDESA